MRVVKVFQWGFFLEHDQVPIYVPLIPFNGVLKFRHEIMYSETLTIVVQNGDLPFFVDNLQNVIIITEESSYCQLIKQGMVEFVIRNQK